MPRAVFHGLDAMRGVAAISVMLYHFSPFLSGQVVLPGAYLAVDLFFVLSGFVICHAYETKLQAGMGLSRFLLVRLVRLYPLYIAGTFIGLLYVLGRAEMLHQLGAAWGVIGLSLLFLPSLTDGGLFPFDLAAWSLFFEIAVNLLYALSARELNNRRLYLVLAVSAAALVLVSIAYGSLDVGMTRRSLPGGAVRVVFSFAMGVVIYRVRPKSAPIRARFGLEALLLALVMIFWLHPAGLWGGLYDLACILCVFPATILLGCRIEPVSAPRFSALLGYLSYPVYVLHTPLGLVTAGVWKAVMKREPTAVTPVSGLLFVATVLIGSYVLTRYYDVPLRAYLGRRVYDTFNRRFVKTVPVNIGLGS